MKRNGLSKTKLAILGLLIGLTVLLVAGCKEPEPEPDNFDGTRWNFGDGMTFNAGSWKMNNYNLFGIESNKLDYEGKYKAKGDTATITVTRVRVSSPQGAWTNRNTTLYAYLNGDNTITVRQNPRSSIIDTQQAEIGAKE